MQKSPINRRHFLKSSALTGLYLSLPSGVLARTFLDELTTKVQIESDNYSIATIASADFNSVDFNGDNINRPHDILWNVDGYVAKKGGWPKVENKTCVVVVGGGVAGLLSAYFLKDQKPLLLEQDHRLGGNSKGELYNKSMYSIGAAYITVPDEGSNIEKTLKDLNLFDRARREADADVSYFFKNEFTKDFWQGVTDPARADEFKAVANELSRIFNEQYPDIPWSKDSALTVEQWQEWDQISFEKWLTEKWPQTHPHILEYFQLYAWSSFNASIDEVSALQMLNFVTAETIGILAFPGGNAFITNQLHKALEKEGAPIESGAFVLRVETKDDFVIITYENNQHQLKAIQCDHCIVAAPKYVARRIVPQISAEQNQIMDQLSYRGYLVANVILKKPVPSVGYDIYSMLGERPANPTPLKPSKKGYSDICFGSWAQNDQVDESVLTLYKPLPYDGAQQFLFNPEAHEKHKKLCLPDLEIFLKKMNLSLDDIKGIRMTRWGHAIPVARTGLLASKKLQTMCEPVQGRIFFANQDNFANPAFETAFTAAEMAAAELLANAKRS